MAPLTFAGVGWILVTLGVSGPLGVLVGTPGVVVTLVGVYRIRWRNQALTWTFWATAALLASLIALFLPIPPTFLHLLVIAALLTAIGVGLATGVRDCLLADDGSAGRPIAHLAAIRLLILATFGLNVAVVIVDDLLFEVPAVTLAVIGLVSLLPSLWLGMVLLQVRDQPSVQEQSTRTS